MDKIFRFSKWFVLFCALLVAARLGQQYVADRAFEERASAIAERIFGWNWLNAAGKIDIASHAQVLTAKVIHRRENDGQVRVEGNQLVMAPDAVPEGGIKDLNSVDNSGAKPQGEAQQTGVNSAGSGSSGASTSKPVSSKFAAVLTLYKDKNKWILGKVEAE